MMPSVASERVTGERVATADDGWGPTWQRHVAAYREAARLLPAGRVLDVGCGIGHSIDLLAPRPVTGVDVDARAVARYPGTALVADMRRLPFDDGHFAGLVAVQSIEHVRDPDRAVGEGARVLEPEGMAIWVTPNRLTFGRADEVIDPYHYVELDAGELETLCRASFESVSMYGLFGSPRYTELWSRERARLDRALALDALRLRRLVPRSARRKLYDAALRRLRSRPDPLGDAITDADFELRPGDLADALDLVAVCEGPAPP